MQSIGHHHEKQHSDHNIIQDDAGGTSSIDKGANVCWGINCCWGVFFLFIQHGPYLLVLFATVLANGEFLRLGFSCGPFIRHPMAIDGNNNASSEYYGLWQQQEPRSISGGSSSAGLLCIPFEHQQSSTAAASTIWVARFCAVTGLCVGTSYLLLLIVSAVCIQIPRAQLQRAGGTVGILMLLLQVTILGCGLWGSLCFGDSMTISFCNLSNNDTSTVFVSSICWFIAGWGSRFAGDPIVTKCRWKGGHNVANACAPTLNNTSSCHEEGASVEEIEADVAAPPSMQDLMVVYSCPSENRSAGSSNALVHISSSDRTDLTTHSTTGLVASAHGILS